MSKGPRKKIKQVVTLDHLQPNLIGPDFKTIYGHLWWLPRVWTTEMGVQCTVTWSCCKFSRGKESKEILKQATSSHSCNGDKKLFGCRILLTFLTLGNLNTQLQGLSQARMDKVQEPGRFLVAHASWGPNIRPTLSKHIQKYVHPHSRSWQS